MSRSVLIVDDSLTVRMDLAEAFEAAGFQALRCGSAAEARAALAGGTVGAAVLDVLLPDGDGVALLAEIRNAPWGGSLPVLVLSTEAEVKDRARGLHAGADEYVGKPYDTGYVVSKVRELLRVREGNPDAGSRTVLIIDDSETYRAALGGAFERAGYGVLLASTGEEGLRVAADRRPAVLIVDGMMPGIDGATVIRRVRLDAALRGVPCLLFTASEDGGAELRALDAGADAFVRKEEDVEVILAKVAALLRRPGAAPAPVTASLAGPRKILAVDDSQTYLQELSEALRDEGYDVVQARSGEEALELLALQSVDCILLDLVMPGLGGQETCRRIKAAPVVRDIPLVLLTAREDRAAMIEGFGAGADDYISKSSELDVLRARVRAQLRRKQFEDENRRIREDLLRSELEASEARGARQVAEARAALADELERKNRELEAFSYSVSHDLRAPLRSIDGFGRALVEDCADRLDERGRHHLDRIRAATQRMGELIDDLLALSRVSRSELRREPVKLSDVARSVMEELRRKEPERSATVELQDGLLVEADLRLVRILLENLLGNAWKFTAKKASPRIELGARVEFPGEPHFFVRDNGAGFDMAYAGKLFSPFQRLHSDKEFPGTGIGLATVQRIVDRHGGRVWAEGAVGRGAAIFFTLPSARSGGRS
ncbi:MAG TPA: response regulator [Myxococcales bacterium]|nr:response regulator [Myxococcales bacterium]